MAAKKNVWASFRKRGFTIKYSKANKTWQVWRGKYLITDFAYKQTARNYAEKH